MKQICVGVVCLLGICSLLVCSESPSIPGGAVATPVGSLCSRSPPKDSVWVRAMVVQRLDNDLYLIKDASGQIILFLSRDELLTIDLKPGETIAVFGTVDISPISPLRNELYAERIIRTG